MELNVYNEFTKDVNNIGWNNFDANVINAYKYKPKSWLGLYCLLYFKNDKGEIIATTDNTLSNISKIDEEFEKFYVNKSGCVDKVEISDNFKILRYKTWSKGKLSECINY